MTKAITFKTVAERTPMVQAAEQLLQRVIRERTGHLPAEGDESRVDGVGKYPANGLVVEPTA